MRKNSVLLIVVIFVLSFSLLACTPKSKESPAATGSPEIAVQSEDTEVAATEAAATEKPAAAVETEFPLLPDATNVMDVQGTLIYQTATKMADVFAFYRKEFTAKGLKENEILTLDGEDVSQLVFTGSDNGKSLIVQLTKLGEASISVTIRYE